MKKAVDGNTRGMVKALIGLFGFGCAYAYAVSLMGERHKGYTWVLVVFGDVVVLLTAAPFIGWKNAMRLFLFFAAAGLPMSIGDIHKGVRALQNAEYTAQRLVSGVASRGLVTGSNGKYVHTYQAPTA